MIQSAAVPIEITTNPYVDPDRAAHEISPDGWHASFGVASSNCPWCHEGAVRGGEGGMGR